MCHDIPIRKDYSIGSDAEPSIHTAIGDEDRICPCALPTHTLTTLTLVRKVAGLTGGTITTNTEVILTRTTLAFFI